MPQAEWRGRLQSWHVGFEDHVGHLRRGPWCAVGETGLGFRWEFWPGDGELEGFPLLSVHLKM